MTKLTICDNVGKNGPFGRSLEAEKWGRKHLTHGSVVERYYNKYRKQIIIYFGRVETLNVQVLQFEMTLVLDLQLRV